MGADAQHLIGYGTLDDAVMAVETGASRYVRLLKDVTLLPDEEICFDLAVEETEGAPLIFDFNGCTITGKRTDNTDLSLFSVGGNFAQGAILRDSSDNPGGIVAEAGSPFSGSNIAVVEGGVYTGSKPAGGWNFSHTEIKGGMFRTTGEYSFEVMNSVSISGGTFCHGTKGAIVLTNGGITPPSLKLSGKIDIVDETPDDSSADLCIAASANGIEVPVNLDLSAWVGGSLDVMLPTVPGFSAAWQNTTDVKYITLPNAKWAVIDDAGNEVTGTMKDGILYTIKVRGHTTVFYDNSESNWEYIMAAFRMDGALLHDQGARIGESSLYFFEIPEGISDIYFTNHMPNMPSEIAPEIPQRTAVFTVIPNETYVFVPGSAGEEGGTGGETEEDGSFPAPTIDLAVLQMVMAMLTKNYIPTVTVSEGGTVTADRSSVRYNQEITYTITPDEGYAVADVIVNGESVGAVSEYTFKNVRKNHTIEVVFEKIGWQNPYSDVTEADWFYEDVQFVSENNLMNGVSEDRFSPDGTLTRTMLVTTLWRLAGQPVVNDLMQFEDVPQDEWYTEAIRWAASEGIVLGYGDGIFGINDSITREQLAVILYRYEQYLGGGFTGMWMFPLRYDDAADVADWAYEAICWLTMKDIYVTNEGNLLDPGEKATRAEIAAFLCRFSKHCEAQEANH